MKPVKPMTRRTMVMVMPAMNPMSVEAVEGMVRLR
jgi:hypothetical protein